MSKVGPTSSTAGKPRRVTANWAFESAPRPKADLQSANRKSSNQRTLQLEMSDVRKLEIPGDGTRTQYTTYPSPDVSIGAEPNRIPCDPASRRVGAGGNPPQYIINCSPNVPTPTEDSCTNDGTDSGLGSATMLSCNQEIMEYMAQNLMQYMNPTLLLPQLRKHNLITEEDTAYISSPQQSDEDKKERVLCALVVQEEDAVERLVECLAGDSAHSTHRYMARKLREALEKKRQHPELQLSTLTPSHNTKETPSSPVPIKPRGVAQRRSIAKLLAAKKNNVASLISQIETKEIMQQPNRTGHPSKPPVEQAKKDNGSIHRTNMGVHYNEGRTSLQSSRVTSPSMSTGTMSYSTPSVTSTSSNATTTTFSDSHSHTHPQSFSSLSYPQPQPTSRSHTGLQPTTAPYHHSHRVSSPPTSLPSPHLREPPITTSHAQCHPCAPVQIPLHTSPASHSFSLNKPPPSLPDDTEDHLSSSASHGFSKRCRPVNEVVLRSTNGDSAGATTSSHATEVTRVSAKEREKQISSTPGAACADQSQKKSLPDFLSSPTTPKSPKVPMLPPINTSLPMYTHPPHTEKLSDNLPSPTPNLTEEDSIQEEEMTPDSQQQRTTRLAGLTARFYKHRRSVSLSSYDTRSFKRGGQLSDSAGGGRKERSPFHHRSKAEPAQVRASVREGTEKLARRRIDWLQERVHFTDCPEHIQFTSQTHYGEERELLYSGTLHKHGKARFVVLFTDYLLVLKARRPSVPSKLGGVFSFQSTRIDWFSDLEYTAKKPLPLHLLTVQHQSSKQCNDSFCLHFNDRSKVTEIVLQAVSKEARDIWVEELSEAITLATSAHADTFLLVGNRALTKTSGEPYKKLHLQIHSASSLGLAANCNSFSLFCVIELGKQRCRTPSVKGGYNPFWDYKCEFTDFSDDDSLLIEVFSENIFRPNDFLGCLNMMLASLPEEQSGRRAYDGNMVLAGLEEAFAGELHVTVEQGWETKM